MQRRLFNKVSLGIAAVLAATGSYAQSDRPISMVVGYSAGGQADMVSRIVAAEMTKRLGRPVVVDNAAGASGMLAVQKVLNGPADGSMIYVGGTDTVVIPMVNPRFKHDWAKDFAPVGRMTTVPMVFAVQASAPYNNLSDLTTTMRDKGRGGLSYATPGIGTMQHLYAELIAKNAKVSMLHVPYKGGSAIANDLVGGQVESAVLTLAAALPFLKEGRIKALSVSDNMRTPHLPNVKAIVEEPGLKGAALPLWQALFVKAGTQPAIVKSYEKALMEVMAQPDIQAKLQAAGITVAPMTGQQLKAFVSLQANVYRDVVTSAKISLE